MLTEVSFLIGYRCAESEMSPIERCPAGWKNKDEICHLSGKFGRLNRCPEAAIEGALGSQAPQLVAGDSGAPAPQSAPN